MRTRNGILLVVVVALLAVGCGSDEGGEGDAGSADGPVVTTASSDLGEILVDGDGMTLYAFLPDEAGTPTCTEGCVDVWPLFEGPATAGEGVEASLLGTAEHPNGTTMATADGWPLYHYASDSEPGDVSGQGVGGNWFVVGSDGAPIQEAGGAASEEAAASTEDGSNPFDY